MKKVMWGLGILVVCMIIGVNYYVYSNYINVKQQLRNQQKMEQAVGKLNDIRLTIVEMGQMQKTYLLTRDSRYKEQYEVNDQRVKEKIEELSRENFLTTTNQNVFLKQLQEYESVNETLFQSKGTVPIEESVERNIVLSNEIQIRMMNTVTNQILTHNIRLEAQQQSLSSDLANQKDMVHVGSGLFSTILASLFLYFRKNITTILPVVEKGISFIGRKKNEETLKEEWQFQKKFLLAYHQYMSEQWKVSQEVLVRLEGKLARINEENVHDLEKDVLELKVMFQLLPGYHEVVAKMLEEE